MAATGHGQTSDLSRVAKVGDSMSGPLILPADPVVPLSASTKQYVDTHGGGSVTSVNGQTGVVVLSFVDLTTAQLVGGVKTFTSAPVVPAAAFPESAVSGLTGDLAARLVSTSNLSDVASAGSARINLGLGSAAVQAASAFLQPSNNLSDVASAGTSRTNLGLGSAAVVSLASLLQAANNLSEITSAAVARANLGLTGAAVMALPVSIANGGTGSSAQNFVDLSAAQSVGGVKTFTSAPVVPAAAFPESAVSGLTTDLAARLIAANNLSDLASAGSARTNLGLGSAALLASAAVAQTANNLSDLASAGTARTNLGLSAGATMAIPVTIANGGTGATTQQAAIDALAGTVTTAQYLRGTGTHVQMSAIQAADVPTLNQNTTGSAAYVTGIVAVVNGGTGSSAQNFVDLTTAQSVGGVKTFTSAPVVPAAAFPESAVSGLTTDLAARLVAASNLSDVASAGTSRTNLGLGSAATQSSSAFAQTANNLSDLVSASTARTNLGLTGAATMSLPVSIANGGTGSSAQTFVSLAGDLGNTVTSPQVTATHLSAALPVNQGGTGSTTQNFVDLTTNQSVAGIKTFTGEVVVPAPVNATDAATKTYVDSTASGLSIKGSCRLATTAALPTNIYSNGSSGSGATLTGVSTGVLTVDGSAVALNDRVLVKNEATGANNGIYVCTLAGAIGVAYILTRSTDMNSSAEIAGAFAFVETGTVNTGAGFVVASGGPYTIGTTAIVFTQFASAGTNFDEVVCVPDHSLFVFNNQKGIPFIAQPAEHTVQAMDIPRMKTDTRFV